MYEEFLQEIRRKKAHAMSNVRCAMESRGCPEKDIQKKLNEIEEQYSERIAKLKSIEVSRNLMGKSWNEM